MGDELSNQLTHPDSEMSRRLREAATSDVLLDDLNVRERGDFMWALYETTQPRDASLLDEAIQATQIAVDLEQEQDDHARLLFNLGARLDARSELAGSLDDLERTMLAFQRAVELTPDGEPTQIERLDRLGAALLEHFDRIGELHQLNAAITAFRRGVELAPDAHPDKPSLLINYGASLQTRFKRLGEFQDVESAIAILRRADELVADAHCYKPQCSTNLANSLLSRFEATGELEDLEQAIWSHRRAVELTPDGHPDKPTRFNNLGNSFLARFKRIGELEDIEQAIWSHRRAVELTPNGHPDKPALFSNLGNSIVDRFRRTGELEHLEQAITMHHRAVELTPDDHPDEPSRFVNLGNSLLTRFERIGELEDLERAISMHRRAVELTPDGHPNQPSRFSNLGNSYLTHFECTGELEDLEQAISMHRSAVKLTPDDHTGKPSRLSHLGSSFRARFERTGELVDLGQGIAVHRRAVELIPDGHPEKPLHFNNLGNLLYRSFERTRKLEDLEQAISSHRRALGLTADDHPQKPSMWSHVCQGLRGRFEQTQEPTDIQEAISAGDRAIELSPEGHANLFGYYNALAACFVCRFEHSGDIDDIRTAISLFERAVQLIPEVDPRLSVQLWNLGKAQVLFFTRTQAQADFDAAVESFMRSTLRTAGRPSIRFKSATCCAHILSNCPSFTTTDMLLSAHSRIIAILPEIVWLGHDIHRRYEESSQLGEIVNTAVAAAVSAGALEQAVEWLEAGRALIWSQVLGLRTPLDELRASHPSLADSLQSVQQQLQSSAHSTFECDVEAFSSVDGLTVNPTADRHRGVVIEYDKLMKNIRACSGFEDFLRPKGFDALTTALKLADGPFVFLNVHQSRSDALILLPDQPVKHVPLPNLSIDAAAKLRRLWAAELKACGVRQRAVWVKSPLGSAASSAEPSRLLGLMWKWIVHPVLKALDLHCSKAADCLPPHITWCPTGPLTQLPLHAAGMYDEPSGPRTFDLVVSSYAPSLSAYQRSCEGAGTQSRCLSPSALVVTQPATPGQSCLPGTVEEGHQLKALFSEWDMEYENLDRATMASVRNTMSQHAWVHLACHGSQHSGDAIKSAFVLYDGPLSLSDLMGALAADNAELAFLSACQTATGDENNPEEAVHLAAGMLAVGFKGVVATMWSIGDKDAPIVVEAYYRKLLERRSAMEIGRGTTGAAYALHKAVRVLREKVGEREFLKWAPFVHFGV